MMTNNKITIGTTDLPNVTGLEVKLNDLDKDSSRTASGKLIRNRIAQIPEITISFGVQTKSQMETLLALLKPASFSVAYYLPQTATSKTANFYAAPHNPTLLTDEESYYDEMTVTLIGYSGI